MSSPLPRPDAQTGLPRPTERERPKGPGWGWGISGDPSLPPGDFRDPEMNEVPGPGILGGVGVGEAREGSAGSSPQDPGVEGHRSERGAGPGQKGPGREVGGGGRALLEVGGPAAPFCGAEG